MPEYCYHCMKPMNGSEICPNCHRNGAFITAAPYHLKAGTVLAGRYLVGDAIGEGGFGITYIGLDRTLAKRVAIKEFYPSGAANRTGELSDGIVITRGREDFFRKGADRFLVEAKSVAAFSDEDGIVDVLDHFRANNTAYIVMEYLDGENLRDHVNRHGLFKSGDLVALMMPVMKSLAVMHSKGVIHRDISPDNIMLTKNGKLKLMDFGSARYYTNEERRMSVVLKKGYAPEEQYRSNGEQGPYTDVYALCATIYACITGKEPADSLDRLVNDTLQPPSRLGIAISAAHEQALMHGLAVRAENRCHDMEHLIREFSGNAGANIYSNRPGQPRQPNAYRPPYGAGYRGYNGYENRRSVYQPDYYPPNNVPAQPQKQKSNTALIVAIVISAVAVLAVGGVIAFLLLSGSGSEKPAASSSHASVSQPDIPSYSSSQRSSESEDESSKEESETEEPSQTESSGSESDTPISEEERKRAIDNIVGMFSEDIKRMDSARSGGEYDYALCNNNRVWVGTKGSFHDDSEIKRWYFFDENRKLYFVYERTDETELRYYVYDDEVIQLTVGIHDVETQKKYYQGDPEIDSSVEKIVSDAYDALKSIP